MDANSISVIILVAAALVVFILTIFSDKKENSISNTMIAAGIALVTSCVPGLNELLIELISGLLKVKISGNEGSYLFRVVTGLVLLLLGILLHFMLKERVYILNMYGIAAQKDIDDPKAIKDLKLAEFKIKEQIIDFVQLFDGGVNIKPKVNEAICRYIKNATVKFTAKVSDQKASYFTGMAPIPYTVFAGTFFESAKIHGYFEYDAHNDGCYRKLKKATKRMKKSGWEHLNIVFPQNINANTTEVVLAISISHKVRNEDLSQFSSDIVHLELDNPQDTNVRLVFQHIFTFRNRKTDVERKPRLTYLRCTCENIQTLCKQTVNAVFKWFVCSAHDFFTGFCFEFFHRITSFLSHKPSRTIISPNFEHQSHHSTDFTSACCCSDSGDSPSVRQRIGLIKRLMQNTSRTFPLPATVLSRSDCG